jgi:probable poly-beta-1,6-N-acetyl-D-glucosamine export protein
MKRGFQQNIHIFRAIAIIMVVCAHTIPHLDWDGHETLEKILDSIVNEASILFFFIAGYLFQYLSDRFNYADYMLNKFKTVILPYFILSVPALYLSVVYQIQQGEVWSWFYDLPAWQQTLLFLATGKHLAPLWFVPTITMYYIVSPLLIWMDRRAPYLYWSIPVLTLISVILGRDGYLGPINKAYYLFPAYVFGMFCSHYQTQVIATVRRIWPVLLVITIGCIWLSASGVMRDYHLDIHILMKIAAAPLLIHVLALAAPSIGSRLDYIAHVSFGIFFIHAYWIGVFRVAYAFMTTGRVSLTSAPTIPGNLLTFIVYAGLVVLLSVVCIWVGQRIFGKHSRMFLGA